MASKLLIFTFKERVNNAKRLTPLKMVNTFWKVQCSNLLKLSLFIWSYKWYTFLGIAEHETCFKYTKPRLRKCGMIVKMQLYCTTKCNRVGLFPSPAIWYKSWNVENFASHLCAFFVLTYTWRWYFLCVNKRLLKMKALIFLNIYNVLIW